MTAIGQKIEPLPKSVESGENGQDWEAVPTQVKES